VTGWALCIWVKPGMTVAAWLAACASSAPCSAFKPASARAQASRSHSLKSVTDAKGQTTTFAYDRNNRLISEKRPLGQQTGYQYNALGQLTKKTDAKNQTSVYTYDNAGRMTQIVQTDAANNTKTINFTYDDAGNLLTYNDGTTSGAYTYDNLYRKTQETTNYGAFSLTTSYSYNQNGTKKTFTYPNGTTIGYTYDANNQPLGINIPGAGSVAYNQYQWTRPQSVTLPDGGTSQYAYDELMRTKAITAKDYAQNPQMNYAYTYDKMDNIKTRNTQAGNYAYNYDNLYRLNEVKKDTAQTEAYTYDQVGNRLTSTEATNWTYDANNELLSTPLSSSGSTGGSSYVYDANGNTTAVAGETLSYDEENRLIGISDATHQSVFVYDGLGRRVERQEYVGGSQTAIIHYVYDGRNVIEDLGSDYTALRSYTRGLDLSGSFAGAGGIGGLLAFSQISNAQISNSASYFYDGNGNVTDLVSDDGTSAAHYVYSPFGYRVSATGALADVNPYQFSSKERDSFTGFYYSGLRYYNPSEGRWLSRDPLYESGGYNLHFAWASGLAAGLCCKAKG